MHYKAFGRHSGLRVSEYALGTANFGISPASAGPDGAAAIFKSFVAAGGTTFDVSNIYQDGEAETILGDLMEQDRDDYVVITKYSGTRQPQVPPGTTGNSRKTMIRSVEASLRRLKTEYIDILMPHFPDGLTPVAEILAGFDDLIRAGKVRYGGLSNFPAWRTSAAMTQSHARHQSSPLVSVQTEYSLAERSAERELLPMAEAHGLGVLLYSPLAGGLLTGKYRYGAQGRLTARLSPDNTVGGNGRQPTSVLDTVLAVAHELDTGAVQVSLAWLRARAARARTSIVPIIGPRTPAHLDSYLAALDVQLEPRQYQLLDEVSAVSLGTPHEDVAAALASGFDGDRSLLGPPRIPVI